MSLNKRTLDDSKVNPKDMKKSTKRTSGKETSLKEVQ